MRMTAEEKAARVRAIRAMAARGSSFAEIGEALAITRQRAQQIAARNGIETRKGEIKRRMREARIALMAIHVKARGGLSAPENPARFEKPLHGNGRAYATAWSVIARHGEAGVKACVLELESGNLIAEHVIAAHGPKQV